MVGAALSVHHLGFQSRSGARLLEGANLELGTGDTLAIAGPNGAGKTTLLNLISGLYPASEGSVLIAGKSIAAMSPYERAKKVALVSQSEAPDGRLRLRDYVALGQMPIWAEYSRREHEAALQKVLSLAQLEAKADSPMARLSGGEKQRAHIARALAQRPRLLLLDEPTNHLDPEAKGRMLSLVSELGIAVVMILHDLVLIPEFASHVAMIRDGRVTHFGRTEDVLTSDVVEATFGVEFLLLPFGERQVPALDIRRTDVSNPKGNPT